MKRYLYIAISLATLLSLVSCFDQGQPAEPHQPDIGTMPPATPLTPSTPVPPPTPVLPPTPAATVVTFQLHSEPLATDWGNEYKMGELVLEDECLRILEDPDLSHRVEFVPSFLPIWPEGFSWSKGDTAVEIFSPSGQKVAQVGDYVRVSGYGIHPERHPGKQVAKSISDDCEGPFYLVGDDITVIEADEPELVQVEDSDIYIRRQKTKEVGFTPLADTADGYGYTSEPLELENDCIVIPYRDGDRYVPIWPAGFTGHIEDGVLEVRNGGGRKIARVGERLRIRGSVVQEHLGGIVVPECGARLLRVKQIINADLPLVFLKHDNRWKPEAEQNKDSIEGEVDVRNGCMHINNHFLWWPSDYEIEEEGDDFRVLDGMGEVVAEKGQDTVLKGHRIRSDDKFGPEIIRMMPTDCPVRTYWIVTGRE